MRSAMSVKQLNPVYNENVCYSSCSIINYPVGPHPAAGGDHELCMVVASSVKFPFPFLTSDVMLILNI